MATDNSIADDQEAMQHLSEISKLLNTGLDETALTACVRLLEAGVTPEALALVVKEFKRQSSVSETNTVNNNSTLSS